MKGARKSTLMTPDPYHIPGWVYFQYNHYENAFALTGKNFCLLIANSLEPSSFLYDVILLMISLYFSFRRYCGYCPQFKYQIGETFGRTTSQLLTTSSVASSGRPVLSDIVPQPRPPKDNRRALIAGRCLNLGDQKLCEEMVPNYTGERINHVCFFHILVLHCSTV